MQRAFFSITLLSLSLFGTMGYAQTAPQEAAGVVENSVPPKSQVEEDLPVAPGSTSYLYIEAAPKFVVFPLAVGFGAGIESTLGYRLGPKTSLEATLGATTGTALFSSSFELLSTQGSAKFFFGRRPKAESFVRVGLLVDLLIESEPNLPLGTGFRTVLVPLPGAVLGVGHYRKLGKNVELGIEARTMLPLPLTAEILPTLKISF